MNQDEINSIVKTNYRFLKSLYIKNTEETDFGFYAWSSADYGDTNIFWNHAVILRKELLSEQHLQEVKEFYEEKNRASSVYIPVDQDSEKPEIESYENSFTDVWMFYQGNSFDTREDVSLKEVKSEEDMEKYVDLFYRSHAADLDDPYAGLDQEYGKQLKKQFRDNTGDIKTKHYIVKLKDEAVGHITTISNIEKAAIYNLGTVPDQRGKGIASATIRETIRNLKDKGVESIFLQTEEGSENEEFFRKRGFKTKFLGLCYTKQV